MHYRQGDLLFISMPLWPEDAVRQPQNVLGEGEKAGHRHLLEAPGELYLSQGELIFRSQGPAVITHPEHKTLELPEGHYRVIQQRQYRPRPGRREAFRRVVD